MGVLQTPFEGAMFESRQHLATEIAGLLRGMRVEAEGRYACLVDHKRVLFESPEGSDPAFEPLRQTLLSETPALFALPRHMQDEDPLEKDLFEDWEQDDFFLAFLNGRVAFVLACPQAEPMREALRRPLEALADRLFRYDPVYRINERGQGLLVGNAQLDIVILGRCA